MEGYRFRVGDKVMYHGEQWEIDSLSVSEIKEPGTKISYERGYHIAKRTRGKQLIRYALENEISAIPGSDMPMTAKEYAEKLRAYFGKPVNGELDIKECFCSTRNCPGCAFDDEPHCVAAVCMFDPERALQMIREAENKNKPKGKTYLQDFMEKMPNARIAEGNSMPYICVKNVYGVEVGSANNCAEAHCEKCWNEEMPEEDNGKG